MNSLNRTHLSATQAEQQWRAIFRDGIVRKRPDSASWVDRWLDDCGNWIVAQNIANPSRVRKSHELKILRAYQGGIICRNREYLDYPKNWEFKRYRTKHWDDYACSRCGAREADGAVLHAHHIVFRSNSGTNSYRNLVTLCFRHHQAEHDHQIGAEGGEPTGQLADQSVEELDSLWGEHNATVLPAEFDELAYAAARPTFEIALNAFRKNGKSAREFFVFLIQIFGRNVGKYALRFADEERRRSK